MRKMFFYNKEKNKNNLNTLSNALASRDKTNINTGNINAPLSQQNQEQDNTLSGALQLGKGALNFYNQGKQNGWFNFGNGGNMGSEAVSGAITDYIGGNGGSSSAISNAISGLGGSGSAIGDSINAEVGSGFGGGGGHTPWGAIGAAAKGGYNTITGQTDADYSDTEEMVAYPLQGASMGAQFGPWGALGGLLYGAGYSLKDDIGLKDNDWLTDIIFPIGMGDEHQGIFGLFGGY